MDPHVLRLAQVLAIVGTFGGFCTVVGLSVWVIVNRVNRGQVKSANSPSLDEARFVRLEQAVDAIAIEVERIGEAQRFATRIMNERAAERLPAGEKSSRGGNA
jgi:hypothetical protein